jgi:hypothetical protein
VKGFGSTEEDQHRRHLFTQRLFNRLMFLRFIQKKGWLTIDGSTDLLCFAVGIARHRRRPRRNHTGVFKGEGGYYTKRQKSYADGSLNIRVTFGPMLSDHAFLLTAIDEQILDFVI